MAHKLSPERELRPAGGVRLRSYFHFSCSLTQMVEDQAANDHTGLDPNEVNTTVTPLPATLPLFATGLGALVLLGWRSKRTTAARK